MNRPAKGSPPRPERKLTPEVINQAAAFLAQGAHIESIAALCGFTNRIWRQWYLRGARELERAAKATHHKQRGILKEEQLYVDLVVAVRESRAQAEQSALLRIQLAAAKGAWKADSWWLQHSFPKRYAQKVQHQGHDGGPVQVQGQLTVVDVLRKVFAQPAPQLPGQAATDPKAIGPADLVEAGVDPDEIPGEDEG